MTPRRDAGTTDEAARLYRCTVAARWLPRALGGALLAAATAVYLELEPTTPLLTGVRAMILAAGVVGALWILRSGSDIRLAVGFRGGALRFAGGARFVELPVEEVTILDWDPPLASARHWAPALVLIDGDDRRWRIPAFLDDGPELLAELLRRSGSTSLRSWAEARRIDARLRRARGVVAAGYLVAGAVIVAVVVFLRGSP